MRVYGFDSTDIQRGEMQAANVDARLMDFPEEAMATLDWEFLSARFVEAKAELIKEMQKEDIDADMIDVVQSLKPAFIPVTDHT